MRFIASTLMSFVAVSAYRLKPEMIEGLKIDYVKESECDSPVRYGHIVIIDYVGRELL